MHPSCARPSPQSAAGAGKPASRSVYRPGADPTAAVNRCGRGRCRADRRAGHGLASDPWHPVVRRRDLRSGSHGRRRGAHGRHGGRGRGYGCGFGSSIGGEERSACAKRQTSFKGTEVPGHRRPQVFGTSATDIVKFDTLLFRAGHNPPMRQLLSRPRNADGVGAPIWKAAAAAVYQIPNTEHMAYRLVRNGFLIIHDGVNNCHSRCLHRLSISFVRLSIFVQRFPPPVPACASTLRPSVGVARTQVL